MAVFEGKIFHLSWKPSMHAMVRWDLHYLETLDQLDLTVDPREVTRHVVIRWWDLHRCGSPVEDPVIVG